MASKQFGKFRQWAGEVISARDKTSFSDEFKELERDIELRKDGMQRLFAASEAYHHALSKKKDLEVLDGPEKLLPIDTFGIVMIVHGEEFGQDSIYGSSLVKLGRAHCKVATLQEAYALTFQDTFISSIRKFEEDIQEYEAHRKKLESRRLSYDAAITKVEKMKNKKEKDRRETEEEMERAKQRYEETLEDVRAHMTAIQENEIDQQRELTSFLELEINFVEQYLTVLKDVQTDWSGPLGFGSRGPRMFPLEHSISKPGSVRSKRSTSSNRPGAKSILATDDSDEEPSKLRPALSRRSSTNRRSDAQQSKPPSRSNSRASRRSNSIGTPVLDKDMGEKSKRMSVTGWASSVMSGRGKKSKDKDQFATLDDDGDSPTKEHAAEADSKDAKFTRTPSLQSLSRKLSSKNKSKDSLPTTSPKVPIRILKPPSLQEKKLVRALYDFSGSSDELSFKVGDEIVVLNEVLEGWWMGELDGKKGLFPTSYTEAISSTQSLARPAQRGNNRKILTRPQGSSASSEDDRSNQSLMDSYHDGNETSDMDEEEHAFSGRPLAPDPSPFYGPSDAASITSSLVQEEDPDSKHESAPVSPQDSKDPKSHVDQLQRRVPFQAINTSLPPPPVMRRTTTADASESFSNVSSTGSSRRGPPPPPPPRRMTNVMTSPPIPERKPGGLRVRPLSGSVGSSPVTLHPTPTSSVSSHGHDVSPFESSIELSSTEAGVGGGQCTQFKQNPFKPNGMCSNCFEFHRDV